MQIRRYFRQWLGVRFRTHDIISCKRKNVPRKSKIWGSRHNASKCGSALHVEGPGMDRRRMLWRVRIERSPYLPRKYSRRCVPSSLYSRTSSSSFKLFSGSCSIIISLRSTSKAWTPQTWMDETREGMHHRSNIKYLEASVRRTSGPGACATFPEDRDTSS